MQISRQALYRTPTPRRPPQRRPPADPVEQAIVAEALANQTDGYRMVCAFVRRRLGRPVNRKRVLRVMRERKLIQRRRSLARRKRPGFFRVERPRQLWQLDLTSIWVAEHGWTYLMAIIDCCTREIVAWQLELRCRADEAIALVEHAAAVHGIEPGELTLGSDNGAAFTARRFREKLVELGIRHRHGHRLGSSALLRKVHLRTKAGFRPASVRSGALRCAQIGTNLGTKFLAALRGDQPVLSGDVEVPAQGLADHGRGRFLVAPCPLGQCLAELRIQANGLDARRGRAVELKGAA
ncbi:MAG: transposase [Gaiellaceae bacterium]